MADLRFPSLSGLLAASLHPHHQLWLRRPRSWPLCGDKKRQGARSGGPSGLGPTPLWEEGPSHGRAQSPVVFNIYIQICSWGSPFCLKYWNKVVPKRTCHLECRKWNRKSLCPVQEHISRPVASAPITQLLQPTQAEDKNKFKYYCQSDKRKSRPAQQFDKVKDDEGK